MMNKEEFWSPKTLAKTLYLKNVTGDKIADVENKLNEMDGIQVHADTIRSVIDDNNTTGKFNAFIYYKILPTLRKLNIKEVFKQKVVKSLLK